MFLKMYLELCTQEQVQNIYDEFNISKESLQNDVINLMEWMEKQAHLPNIKDEEWLAKFVLSSKNSLEKSKTKLDLYYKTRALLPDIFSNRDPCSEENKQLLNTMTYVALPQPTPDGHRVLVWKIFDPKQAQQLTADQFTKIIYFNTDFLLKTDNCGKIYQIFDLENVSLSFAVMMMAAVRKIALTAKAIGILRVSSVVVLHINSVLEPILNTMMSVLPKKIQNRVVFRGNNTDLTNVLPMDILPSDYSGSGKSLLEYRDAYLKCTEKFKDWFNYEETVKADLTKIIEKNFETHQQLFGVDGSFKKLSLD